MSQTSNSPLRTRDIFLGFLFSNIAGSAIVALSTYMVNNYPGGEGIFVYSTFVLIPILMGIICAYCWRNTRISGWLLVLFAVVNSIIAILLSGIFLGEGIFCLLIVSPLVMGFMIAGVFIGKVMFRKNRNKLNFSIAGILFILFVQDSVSDHNYVNMVSDTIVINATPDKIWPYVVAYEPITDKPDFWMFRLGMPAPVQSTAGCYCLGGDRKCIFNDSIVFDEKMVVFDKEKNLTFDVTRQPRDPELLGHIEIQRGQFLLKDNGDGTTTLTGNSWYKLNVFPIWYYDRWAISITRNVHLRVMKQIKKLAEE